MDTCCDAHILDSNGRHLVSACTRGTILKSMRCVFVLVCVWVGGWVGGRACVWVCVGGGGMCVQSSVSVVLRSGQRERLLIHYLWLMAAHVIIRSHITREQLAHARTRMHTLTNTHARAHKHMCARAPPPPPPHTHMHSYIHRHTLSFSLLWTLATVDIPAHFVTPPFFGIAAGI